MKLSFKDFFRALPAPIYALIMRGDYKPRPQDVIVWFLLFLAMEMLSMICDWIGWHRVDWNRASNVALFACLLCRLHYLEYAVELLTKATPEHQN